MGDGIALRDRLGVRLGMAFAMTAVGAVVVALALAWATAGPDVDRLRQEQREVLVQDVAGTLAVAHAEAGGWEGADLLPAHTLAASAGAVLTVSTTSGAVLPVPHEVDDLVHRLRRDRETSTIPPADTPGSEDEGPTRTPHGDDRGDQRQRGVRGAAVGDPRPLEADAGTEVEVEEERSRDVVVDGTVVGRATLLFTRSDRFDPVAALRASLTRDLLLAGVAGAALGLLVAAWVTPHLTRPLRRLTVAVDRVAHGSRAARSGLPSAVGELGVLVRAVDRMAADLEREDRLRRALVADVAHEVRTPLTVLLGEVEALEDGLVDPDAARLASLHEEVLRLARLVEDLDAIAAAEAAGLDLRREPLDLAPVVRAALSGLAAHLATTGVDVDATLAPVHVQGDPGRLEQVVRNLVANAAKFSPSGGRVSVELTPVGDDAVLRVTDDGPGIPPGELSRVFERFWRGAHAAGTAGSGVGLAVVAELVAAHGGQVIAGNAAGRGAELTVRLPRVTAPRAETRARARPLAGPARGA